MLLIYFFLSNSFVTVNVDRNETNGNLKVPCQVRHISATESALKMMEKAFDFNLKTLFILKAFKFSC